ncbi:Homocysteine S-methyltransferase 1 [Blyttiomyces sp. JEL0837]|nr:Homocysteine S-methyltransferase 1 [Blyttiomyces sp. JEL0837]
MDDQVAFEGHHAHHQSAFCPVPPFFSPEGLLAPCLIDNVTAFAILVTAVISLILAIHQTPAPRGASRIHVFFTRRHRRPNSEDNAVRRSLLNDRGEPNAASSIDQDRNGPIRPAAIPHIPRHLSSLGRVIQWSSILVVIFSLILFTLDAIEALFPSPTNPVLPQRDRLAARFTSDAGSAAAWVITCVVLHLDNEAYTAGAVRGFWSVAMVGESIQLYQWLVVFLNSLEVGMSILDGSFMLASVVRSFLVVLIFVVGCLCGHRAIELDLETHSDLESGHTPNNATPSTSKVSTWTKASKNLRNLLPFLWPHEIRLQFLVILSFTVLMFGRVVNVLVPLQYKMLIDTLTSIPAHPAVYYAWGAVLTFCFLRYLQGGVGVISSIQSMLWIPVSQYNTREVSVKMLGHLHSLSLQFHINRKTGEVLRVMDRGTSSISSLISALLFNIVPVFIDIGVAVIWFIYQFDVATGVIVLITMVLYILFTVLITEWRTKFRREMNDLDSASRAHAVDSLLNFETVKYYNNEAYEVARFDKSIRAYQQADWISQASLVLLNTAQNTVITLGLVAGSLLCATRVVRGENTIGDFILFITYIVQLYQPLNFFGTYYRVIQQNFVDLESMFDLLEENAAVKDSPGAKELIIKDGGVVFDNVSFGYDPRTVAIHNLSFTVPPKTTTALVGSSGSGKSTIFRLLFRFYDPQSGRILIDGQDISTVTQVSLRRAIGVVPQDTVLFNNTIGYNIGYGDVTKSFEEVVEAAQRAQIHDRVMTFSDQYDTKVGERGLRLSGGEKQRVAIARTLLKDPKIILLDEATSALDNQTEALIQRSLKELTSRRTTLVIAHRLSTIVDADCIIVMKDGRIVEKGTHADLLARGEALAKVKQANQSHAIVENVVQALVGSAETSGVKSLEADGVGTYYAMWMRQLEDEKEGKIPTVSAKDVVAEMRRGKKGASDAPITGHGGHGGGGRFH